MASIDVTEIITGSIQPPAKKQRRNEGPVNVAARDEEDILNALENDESSDAVLDESVVKRLVLQLEKRCSRNRELRIKHSDEPTKFMESEISLNESIQEMNILATQPELYKCALESGLVITLLELLSHENSDIIAATLNLLQELVDVNLIENKESEEGITQLLKTLVDGQLIETIVQQSIERLDENLRDEADAVHFSLSVIETVLDFNPDSAEKCVEQGLFLWLLRRTTQRGPLDANKMYAGELLSVLLQNTESAKKRLTERIDGFDLLLRALAGYKRHDPSGSDEREHMENLFDSVCAALLYAPNRQKFLDAEGLQLMNLMLRERKQSRQSALKVLDYAMNGVEGRENCTKFIEILGLRTIFPLFMRTPAKDKRKDTTPMEHEEHVCSILSSLLRSCSDDGRTRVLVKFAEHEFEKVDRAVELFLKYRELVYRFDSINAKNPSYMSENDDYTLYMDRLDAGLYTLQRVALILADVCASTLSASRVRVVKLLQMRTGNGRVSRHLIPVLDEYESNLGADADEERKRVRLLIARLSSQEKKA